MVIQQKTSEKLRDLITHETEYRKGSQLVDFFNSLETRENYFIYGITFMGVAIGACGLKNFINEKAELWLYIGDKSYWGKGLGKIIMNRLEEKALDKNLLKLYLKVIKENVAWVRCNKSVAYRRHFLDAI